MSIRQRVPNALTVLRLVLAGLFPLLPRQAWVPVFALAAATEFLDGWLARRWGVISPFGQRLDPVADKLFLLSVAVTLLLRDVITPLELVLAGIRDGAVMLFLVVLLLRGGRPFGADIKPRWPGKICTTFQFVLLVSWLGWGHEPPGLLIATALAGLWASVDYYRAYEHLLKGEGEAPG